MRMKQTFPFFSCHCSFANSPYIAKYVLLIEVLHTYGIEEVYPSTAATMHHLGPFCSDINSRRLAKTAQLPKHYKHHPFVLEGITRYKATM